MDMDKQKALEAALAQIDRAFGKGSAMKLGSRETMEIETISTGSLGLDIALGIGGLPRGRVIEIYGPESSGKTTLALHAIAEAQKAGGTAAFIDAEHALDPVYAKKLGVDIDNLIVSQPDTGEQALEIVDTLVRSNAIDVLVINSVAALVPRAEIEGEMGDSHVGLQARLMSQSLRKLTGSISKSRCLVIFINQLRMKIGVMYGNPETTTGGNALKFYASVRLDIRRTGQIKDRDEIVGNTTRVKVVKNKVAPPFKQVEFDIMYGEGISKIGEILDLGVKAGLVEKSGAWFSYNSIRIGQGRENAKTYLKENPEIADRLEARDPRPHRSGRRGDDGRPGRGGRRLERSVRAGRESSRTVHFAAHFGRVRLKPARPVRFVAARPSASDWPRARPASAERAADGEAGDQRQGRAVEHLADHQPDQRAADRRDQPLQRRGGAGDMAERLHRQRAGIGADQAEAGHGQRLQRRRTTQIVSPSASTTPRWSSGDHGEQRRAPSAAAGAGRAASPAANWHRSSAPSARRCRRRPGRSARAARTRRTRSAGSSR